MKRFWHSLFGCSYELVAWSIMGNPIERCSYCGGYAVSYGSINPMRKRISCEEAESILSDVQ